MKKLKMIIALTLSVILFAGMAAVSASAEDSGTITVSLRIEAIEECIYYDNAIKIAAGSTVADLMKIISDMEGTPYIAIINGEFGAYVGFIDDLMEFEYGEMSGWNYRVNDIAPSFGISLYTLKDGDCVVYYYGDPFGVGIQCPEADWSGILTDGIIRFSSLDTTYDENWEPTVTENPVAGATVTFRWDTYVTNDRGEIRVEDKTGLSGCRTLQIQRHDEESGVPTVLRFAPDYMIYIPFVDTPQGAWYEDAVRFCVREGYFIGTNLAANLFNPTRSMTIPELFTVLARIAGEDVDVPTTPWYATAFEWAVKNGIIAEDETIIGVNVTRERFIHMFYQTIGLVGGHDMELRADITIAKDYSDIAPEYRDAISWAVASGIIDGTDPTQLTISPNKEVNRVTVCKMLYNYYN